LRKHLTDPQPFLIYSRTSGLGLLP